MIALVLTSFLGLNLIIATAVAGLLLVRRLQLIKSSRGELQLHYLVLGFAFVFMILQPFLPRPKIFSPPAKIWAGEQLNSPLDQSKSSFISIPILQGRKADLPTQQFLTLWYLGIAILISASFIFLMRNALLLHRMTRGTFCIRRIGRVRISISENIQVPFTYLSVVGAHIVIPAAYLLRPTDYRIAILHELQHHRQQDTIWIYGIWMLRLLCIFNPLIHIWHHWISELQEFACDETLVDQKNVDSRAYASCLIEAAQTIIRQRKIPVCATGLTFRLKDNFLKRRIEKMFKTTDRTQSWKLPVLGGIFFMLMAGVSYAAKSSVQDRRVTLKQAETMRDLAQKPNGFPLVVNEDVLRLLNRYAGTPEGRDFMRASLERLETHRAVLDAAIQKYNVPAELLALPIIESGYRNLPQAQNPQWPNWGAAGIWQFIASTARHYGLKVDEQKDERLDVALETDAALRYLLASQLRFKNWALSVMAYNMGETALQKSIDKWGSRDPWTLIQRGTENDKDYLAKVTAAILILKNPEVLD